MITGFLNTANIAIPTPDTARPIQSALTKCFLMPLIPKRMLVTSMPEAAAVSTIPNVFESENESTKGSPNTWNTPMKRQIREETTTRTMSPFVAVTAAQPSFMLLKNGSGSLLTLVLIPALTTAAATTVRKNVQMSMMRISLMSLTARMNPAMIGEKMYLEEPAIDTRPLAFEYCSLVRRSVIVAV